MKTKTKFYTPVLLALLTVTAYYFADTVDLLIGMNLSAAAVPNGQRQKTLATTVLNREFDYYAPVLERGLFGDGNKPAPAPVQAASPDYTLIGTVEGGVFAGAVLADKTGQVFYRIRQKLPDQSSIIKVRRNKVTLQRPDGGTFDIEIVEDTKIVPVRHPAPGVRKLTESSFMVDKKEVLASTENLSQILMQARALPYIQQGKVVGFRITEIVPNSIYAKIGLQNGDVIQQINSQPIDDPGKFFQLYQGLRNENNITIDLLRNGKRQTISYDIR